MNRAFSKIWIIIVLIVLVAGGILAWQYFGAPKEKVEVPEEIIEDETADWKTYRNERYGFEVKHPENWLVTLVRENFGIELSRIQFQSTDHEEIEIKKEEEGLWRPILLTKGMRLELIITEIPSDPTWCRDIIIENKSRDCTWRDWAQRPTDWPYGELLREEFLISGEKEIYLREVEYKEAGYEKIISIVVSFPDSKETKLFEFVLDTLEKDKEKNFKTFNQTLSTFRFSPH